MTRISKHSKERLVERVDSVNNFYEAKKKEKLAWSKGKTINHFQTNPEFCDYLRNKRNQSRECSVRVYEDYIYIWKGKQHKLVTVHPIPEVFKND